MENDYIEKLKKGYSNDLETLQDTEKAIENLINRAYEDGFIDGKNEVDSSEPEPRWQFA